jgi:hypothetical protein
LHHDLQDDKTFQVKIKELGNLLSSDDEALYLYLAIIHGVNSKDYKRDHLSISINVLKFHFMRGGNSLLSSLQLSITSYTTQLKDKSPQEISKLLRIIKKIYKYFVNSNLFLKDLQSKNFCIYDVCPPSQKDVMDGLWNSLEKYSYNEEITQATKLFISSKKVIKNYLRVTVNAYEAISNINEVWSSSTIKQGLESFRDSYNTDNGSLSTKYHAFSSVLELFSYLKNVDLISKETVLPKNIKKPSNSNLMRSKNPAISSINIDKLTPEQSMTSANTLIDKFHNELNNNLDCIIDQARNVIFCRYKSHELNQENNNFPEMDGELIAAMQVVITNELGINPTSLYNLKVNISPTSGPKHEFIKVEDDGSVRINVIKWRQRKLQKRTTEPSICLSYKEMDVKDINAAFCIQFAILLTKSIRQTLGTNLLWLSSTQRKIRTQNTNDIEFRKFCNKYLPKKISQLNPTLMKVRTSRAMAIYISSHGDIVKTATYLGNKVKTSLNTYIPQYLQEIIYRRKISVFQHLFLVLATANEPEKLKLLGMDEKKYKSYLKEIYQNEDFGGTLFEKLKPKAIDNTETEEEAEIFFICSPQNFAFAIKLLKTSKNKDTEVYKVCLNTINKAASGNIMQKKMILEAEDILAQEGFEND